MPISPPEELELNSQDLSALVQPQNRGAKKRKENKLAHSTLKQNMDVTLRKQPPRQVLDYRSRPTNSTTEVMGHNLVKLLEQLGGKNPIAVFWRLIIKSCRIWKVWRVLMELSFFPWVIKLLLQVIKQKAAVSAYLSPSEKLLCNTRVGGIVEHKERERRERERGGVCVCSKIIKYYEIV